MTQEPNLVIGRDGPVAVLTLNRPEAANAPDDEMAALLRDACAEIATDDEARVVLLTGAGAAFCVSIEGSGRPASRADLARSRVAATVAALDRPVVVALNGDAIGQGLEIALAGDLRLATDSATFAMPQVTRGFLPWDGGTQRLPRTVGLAWALDLLLTGRTVGAQEAAGMGLVHQVAPAAELLPRAMELAQRVASHGPIALRYTKEAVTQGMDLGLMGGLGLELDLNVLLHTTADRAEGIGSFLERRDPRFRGE